MFFNTIMDYTSNIVALHLRIDTTMKTILSDGKIDSKDIPTVVMLILELISTPGLAKMTEKELKDTIGEMYKYIMTHYNLFPGDSEEQAAFKSMFEASVKLALFQPSVLKVKEAIKSRWLACFK
jgi:hypothetical protein